MLQDQTILERSWRFSGVLGDTETVNINLLNFEADQDVDTLIFLEYQNFSVGVGTGTIDNTKYSSFLVFDNTADILVSPGARQPIVEEFLPGPGAVVDYNVVIGAGNLAVDIEIANSVADSATYLTLIKAVLVSGLLPQP